MPLPILAPQFPIPTAELSATDYANAAVHLGCEPAAIRAVAAVEAPRGAFDDQGRPTILFERHLFHSGTCGRFDDQPDISNPVAGGYGPFSVQYPKLERAATLSFDVALRSTSWGMFQILGSNCKAAGFDEATDFVNAMRTGAPAHLAAFRQFISADDRLLRAIRAKDWASFARFYNGPAYAQSQYDVKLAAAYNAAQV